MKKNILLIVEGEKTENEFFKNFLIPFEDSFEIFCFKTNIYGLYKKIKEMDFNADIKSILAEIHPNEKEKLSNNFLYTYLIFDCDIHHPKSNETRLLKDIINDNFTKLKEMADYFIDETDPTIGKLYINYPMMESFRDCDDFFDNNYKDAFVTLENIPKYKNIVSTRKLIHLHIDKYKKENYESLMLQNLYKLDFIINGFWGKPNYDTYLEISNSLKVLEEEYKIVNSDEKIAVLNTSLFLIIDYFGNNNNFYDNLLVDIKNRI